MTIAEKESHGKMTKGNLNRKKVEKDRKRKQFDDIQVQGTNNSSIVSKRSVEILYNKKLEPDLDDWFKYFVPREKRRSPAINRGYWIRMEAIKRIVINISHLNEGAELYIVNLGCGFDPLPFQLLSKGLKSRPNVTFIDIDYPDLVENKLQMIKKSDAIISLLGNEVKENVESGTDLLYATNSYKLVGCDLKDGNAYNRVLGNLIGSSHCTKIFIAEVSLAYMEPQFANSIIDYSSRLKDSHFVILEQILPNGVNAAFAQKMLDHFRRLRSPLRCVEKYPQKRDQEARFGRYYPYSEIKDLFQIWEELIETKTKSLLVDVELFDEWEEFIMFCHHYAILHATNVPRQQIFDDMKPQRDLSVVEDSSIKMSVCPVKDSSLLQLKFPAVAPLKDKVIINGGLNSTRINTTLSIKNGEIQTIKAVGSIPSPRMCHTLTALDNKVYLFGGRSKPLSSLKDSYVLEGNSWTKLENLPNERDRHCSIALDEEKILIFGGLAEVFTSDDLFLIYNVSEQSFRKLRFEGDPIPNLKSCAIAYNRETRIGVLVGGILNSQDPDVSGVLYKFSFLGDSIKILNRIESLEFKRIGCAACFIGTSKILIAGGVSPSYPVGANDSILTYDLEKHDFQNVHIPQSIQKEFPPILVGFSMVKSGPRKLLILGGGAVCYSFGSYYNGVFEIDY